MEENAQTQSEIVRLNRIITILIDEIELLKQENAYFRRNNGKIKKKPSGVMYDNGINEKNNSSVNIDNGSIVNKPSAAMYDNGILIDNASTDMSDNGNITNKNSVVIPAGSQPQTAISAKKEAPANIEINYKNESLLGVQLRKFFHVRIKEKSVHGLARELLVMHNNGFADSKELRKAAGLSESGFAKHFPMIKRKGWVYKQGVRKYALTPSAKALVDEVFGVEKN